MLRTFTLRYFKIVYVWWNNNININNNTNNDNNNNNNKEWHNRIRTNIGFPGQIREFSIRIHFLCIQIRRF